VTSFVHGNGTFTNDSHVVTFHWFTSLEKNANAAEDYEDEDIDGNADDAKDDVLCFWHVMFNFIHDNLNIP
jgi:hypothetical protein